MFERFTEKARRVIFFARYEASHYGSPEINTEHLLLGLVREDKDLWRWFPKTNLESIRQRVDEHSLKQPSIPTNVDLPLSGDTRRVLKYAAEEADRLAHKHIGTEHLLLGLLDEEGGFAAVLLREGGADAEKIRLKLDEMVQQQSMPPISRSIGGPGYRRASAGTIEIHGIHRSAERVRDAVQRCRMNNWHWEKRSWTNADIAIEKKTGKVSFNLSLAKDAENFELVRKGWRRDRCFVCGWELFESQEEADHSTGYTNGRNWLCTECYTKFWERPDFFSSSYSDIT
jgi:hypothetical protein